MTEQEWENLDNYQKAWKLGLIMQYMNDEDAYYESGWLYIWPDGETYQECMYDFQDEESYKELERSFIGHYSEPEYHEGGLFASKGVPKEVLEAAHYWDQRLGLEPIKEVKISW